MYETTTSIWEFGSNLFDGGLLNFIIHAIFALFLAHILSKCISSLTKPLLEKGKEIQKRYLDQVLKAIVYILAVFIILDQVKSLKGIGTAALGATSVISVVIGLAAQETFGNFIAGISLSLTSPFTVGDLITLPEKSITGTVTNITFRHTELRTMENTKVIVPNSTMNSAIIEDRVYGQSSFQRFITFSVGYDTDIETLKNIMNDVISKEQLVIDGRSDQDKKENKPIVQIRIDDFLDSGIQVWFPLITKTLGDNYTAASNIRIALLDEFKKNGIEIPYNKVEVINAK